jgi:hypothetical protein
MTEAAEWVNDPSGWIYYKPDPGKVYGDPIGYTEEFGDAEDLVKDHNAALQKARKAALEEAAVLCETLSTEPPTVFSGHGFANKIRALIGDGIGGTDGGEG